MNAADVVVAHGAAVSVASIHLHYRMGEPVSQSSLMKSSEGRQAQRASINYDQCSTKAYSHSL